MEKRALGKGLSALIPPKEAIERTTTPASATGEKKDAIQAAVLQVPVSQIKTNKYQPRTEFDQEKLNELTSSIKEKGVIQPVLVRKTASGYELIAGERRLRASKMLGIETIPAIVKEVSDVDMLEISLIENIQRAELNPIEEAYAYRKFITDFNFTQEKIATVLGKDRSTIANTLRLLGLPEKVRLALAKGELSAGHAKTLLALPTETEQLRVATIIIKKGISVRETEQLVARRLAARPQSPKGNDRDQNIMAVETELQQRFGTRVRILHGKKRGRIQIEYYSTEDFNRILGMLHPKKS